MTRPNENPEFMGEIDLVIMPGRSSMLGFGEPKGYFQILQGECLVRYGNVTETVDGRRIGWSEDGGGKEVFKRGDVFGAGDGRVVNLRNAGVELAVVHKINTQ